MRPQPLLTPREAAARLHVSDSTLRRLRRSGAITDIWIGRRSLRFDPAAIDAYITARQRAVMPGERRAA